MPDVSGTGGGRRPRGRDSLESELRSLNLFYQWGTLRSPRSSPPSTPRGGGVSSTPPPGSVTKRSRSRRRRGNLNLDIDSSRSIANVESSWQEAAGAAITASGSGSGSGSGGGQDGSGPLARSWAAPGEEEKHGAGVESGLVPNAPPRRVSSNHRLLVGGGGHANSQLSPALPLPPGANDADKFNTASPPPPPPPPPTVSSPLPNLENGEPASAEYRSTADRGKPKAAAGSSAISDDEHDSPLESESAATAAAAIGAGASGGGDESIDGCDCADGERTSSAGGGLDCGGYDSGNEGYCSQDAAEEWNVSMGGDVSMVADLTLDGDNNSMGNTGGNSTGGEEDRPVGGVPADPGAADSGDEGYCSPDTAEEWNMSIGGDVSMVAGPSSGGDYNSTGNAGGNATGGEEDRPVGGVLVEPATAGDGKSRPSATGASRRPASVYEDSGDDEDVEVRKGRGKEAARRPLGKASRRRRVVSESSDSDSCSPTAGQEGEGSSSDGAAVASAAAAAAGEVRSRRAGRLFRDERATKDHSLDAGEGADGSAAREEAGEEEGSGGDGSGDGVGETRSDDDDAGHDTAALTETGRRRFPRNPPRRQKPRRIISSDEEASNSGGSCLEEGVNATAAIGRRNSGLEACGSAVTSCASDDGSNAGGPRHLRREPPVAPGAAAAAAAAAATVSELSDDASSGDKTFEEPTGSCVGGHGRWRGASGRRTAAAAASSSSASPSSSCSSSWSPVSRKPAAGRSLRNGGSSRRNRQVLSSSDDSNSDEDGGGGGSCDFDSPLFDGSSLASPVTRDGDNFSRSGDAALSLSPVSSRPSPPPRRQHDAGGKGVRAERGAGVASGGGSGKGIGGGSRGAKANGSSVDEELRGAAFLQVRDSLTAKCFEEFNEGAFGGALSDVRVAWSARLKTTAGVTKSLRRSRVSGGFTYESVVELSTKVLDSETKLRQTLLHELCHAAAWVVDHKSKPPHGSHFWAWANRAKAAHPGVPVTTCHSYSINYKYRYVCVGATLLEGGDGGPTKTGQGCGAEIGRHSKSINVQTQVCGRCRGRLALFGTHNVDGKLKKPRAASGFSLFVKERYAEVKKALPPGTKQQEVMKEMSRQWAARENRNGRTSGDGRADASGGGSAASPSPRAIGGSSGLGSSTGAKKTKAAGGTGRGAAASSADKENASFFDLT